MARRSVGFTKRANDYYPTPFEQAAVLHQHLPPGTRFVEPCAGAGDLVRHLQHFGHVCTHACDIDPQDPLIDVGDGASIAPGVEPIITNPPWSKGLLLPLLTAWLTAGRDVVVLLPVNTICNVYWAPFAPHTHSLMPAGRPRWIPNSPHKAKDDAVWVSLKPESSRFLLPRVTIPRLSR